jgi:hypothetical protein
MTKGMFEALLCVGLALCLAVVFATLIINSEERLRMQAQVQQQHLLEVFDTTWEIIQHKGGVSDTHADAFKQIYPDLMEGRYNQDFDGALLRWITLHNPHFDVSLYGELKRLIEVERIRFAFDKMALEQIVREHEQRRESFPGWLFVGSRPAIKHGE